MRYCGRQEGQSNPSPRPSPSPNPKPNPNSNPNSNPNPNPNQDIVVAEKVKVEAEEAASRSVEVLKKEVAKLKITAERHETQQHEHVESFKAEKVS